MIIHVFRAYVCTLQLLNKANSIEERTKFQHCNLLLLRCNNNLPTFHIKPDDLQQRIANPVNI